MSTTSQTKKPETKKPVRRKAPEPVDPGPGLYGFRREFTQDGVTYTYNFSEMKGAAIMCAEAIFDSFHQALRKPPRNYRELELSDQMDYMARAFSYMLRKRAADGTLEPWDRARSVVEAEKFFRNLDGDHWTKVQEAKQDFFAKADIVDAKLMQQLEPMIGAAQAAQSLSATTEPSDSEPSENGRSATLASTE